MICEKSMHSQSKLRGPFLAKRGQVGTGFGKVASLLEADQAAITHAYDPFRKYAKAAQLFDETIRSVAEDPEYEVDDNDETWPDKKQILSYQRLLYRGETKLILQLVWENEFLREAGQKKDDEGSKPRRHAQELTKHGIAAHLAGEMEPYSEVHRYRILVLRILEALEYFDLIQIKKVRTNRSLVFGTEKLKGLMEYVSESMSEIFSTAEVHHVPRFKGST